MQTKKELAMKLFCDGFNCAQSIVGAFSKEMGLTTEQALKLSSPFGAGMGKLRHVCGAVSGMFMVLGMIEGYDCPDANKEKEELYMKVQNLANSFKERNETIICSELLQGLKVDGGHKPQERNEEYYKIRPCARFVGDAAEILEKHLNNK